MRPNPVKDKLLRGENAFGTMIFECVSPGLPAILKNAGAEFVLYDMEHSGLSTADIKQQAALCRGLDIVPMVRPPGKQYHIVARLLDLGVMGLMYQMLETPEEAEEIVSWTRYPPTGVRGAMFSGAHDDYDMSPVPPKMAAADARTMNIALIETVRGIENVDAIMAVDGVDAAWIGHFDLSLTMGIPGEFTNPDFIAAVERVFAACKQHGKAMGVLAPTVEWGRDWMAKGANAIAYSGDIWLLMEGLRAGIDALREG